MADVDTSIYKNQPNPLATLSGVYGVVNAAQYNQLLQANTGLTQLQLQGQQGVANAYRNNVNPDGTINNPGLISALGRSGPLAGPAIGQAVQNSTAQTNLAQGQYNNATQILGSLSNDPTVTRASAVATLAQAVKNGQVPASMGTGIQTLLSNPNLDNPKALHTALSNFQNYAMGPAAASSRVPGPLGQGFTPSSITQGQANVAGGYAAGPPIGYGTQIEAPIKAANELEATANTTNQQRADLENMRADANVIGTAFGPTFHPEKTVNQVLSRFGIPGTMTREELAKGESFDKIAHQLAGTQTAQYGASDARQANSIASLPSSSLSGLGTDGIINMLQGNTDAVDAKRNAWFQYKKANNGNSAVYNDFSNDWNNKYDPRVFQIARMTDPQRKAYMTTLAPPAQQDLASSYANAVHDPLLRKWVKP